MSAPSNNTYILRVADPTNLPNGLALATESQLGLTIVGTNYVLGPTQTLRSIANANQDGFLAYNNTDKAVIPITFQSAGGTIAVTNPQGITGANALNLETRPGTTVQKVNVTVGGAAIISTEPTLNFIAGANTTIVVADDVAHTRANITISSTAGSGAVNITSPTGLLIEGSGTNTLTIDFPGSTPGTNLPRLGDMLVGIAGAYAPVELGAPGTVWTSEGGTGAWVAPVGTAVTLTSPTGLLVTGSGSDTLTIDFPGSAPGTNLPRVGDMLIGIAGGKYDAVEIGAANTVWTSNATTGSWQPPAASVVNITSPTGLVITGSGTDTLTINLPGSNPTAPHLPRLGDMLVGTAGTYGVVGIGANGDQWTVVSGTGAWVTPTTSGVGPSGTDVFDAVFVAAPFASLSYKFFPDSSITAGSVVMCSPFVNATGAPEPAENPFAVTDALDVLGNGAGYYIFSGITTGGSLVVKGFSYVVVKY